MNTPEEYTAEAAETLSGRELMHKVMEFARNAHAWRAHQHHAKHKNGMDTSRGQGRILAALNLKDGIPTRELAYVLGIRVPSLNESLAKLEEAGHIRREADVNDKRIKLIYLTESGREMGASASAEPKRPNFFEVLTEQERAQFADMMDRLNARLSQELPDMQQAREEWEAAARERMGDERFEEWMSRARRGEEFGFGPRDFGRGGFERGFGRGHRGGFKHRGEQGVNREGFGRGHEVKEYRRGGRSMRGMKRRFGFETRGFNA
ncbi:MAG: MarR family transcriptional regulator [Rothia sp. (in: high G+C Gram-positive bacteria)]|uniref:MarR family winged helix-turn-helix transcriptional regulator n=1 Tax=Rothia sp. (in: high G+C Gram-positive bacteria) TaxID=1885016 RepID=UPI0026E083EA|nr:MarR family transcriptional regulator [Rothia sp. (in: high G+C Gram-positive bacteria)]MDO5749717.1 MarR family transcriptional regulator [Rothia sp. (in: high G+C Gram-positive bacteria)]